MIHTTKLTVTASVIRFTENTENQRLVSPHHTLRLDEQPVCQSVHISTCSIHSELDFLSFDCSSYLVLAS